MSLVFKLYQVKAINCLHNKKVVKYIHLFECKGSLYEVICKYYCFLKPKTCMLKSLECCQDELFDIKLFYVYWLICQVLYVTYRSTESQHVHLPVFRWLSDRSNEGCIVQSCGSLLLKCYAQSVNVFGCWFFFYVQTCQVPTYMCVLYRYLNLLVDLLLKVLKHWMYIHVCTDVSVRTNLFSLRFPGTCCTVSSVIVQEHCTCTSQKTQLLWSARDRGVWFVIHLFVSDRFIYHLLFWTRWMKLSSFLA